VLLQRPRPIHRPAFQASAFATHTAPECAQPTDPSCGDRFPIVIIEFPQPRGQSGELLHCLQSGPNSCSSCCFRFPAWLKLWHVDRVRIQEACRRVWPSLPMRSLAPAKCASSKADSALTWARVLTQHLRRRLACGAWPGSCTDTNTNTSQRGIAMARNTSVIGIYPDRKPFRMRQTSA